MKMRIFVLMYLWHCNILSRVESLF